jgi:hypothetical protein
MSELQTKFDELLEKQRAIAAEFQQTAQQLFKETTTQFFVENPGVKAIVWKQYTPYFNDGDTCEFSVNDPYFTNAEGEDLNDISWGEYEGDRDDIWSADSWSINKGYDEDTRELIEKCGGVNVQSCDKFSSIICSSEMQDVMLAMFGDHVEVVATAQGFDVSSYDHD